MTYRVRRKFTSSKFYIDDRICKIFFKPDKEYKKGYWRWKVGFAIGKSNRQLNDWWKDRVNKRARSINKKITGRTGMKAIRKGFQEVLRLRWIVAPGDCVELDCTSGDPSRQFHAWSRWHKYHPEWVINYEEKSFFWYRPPYPDDAVYKTFNVIPVVPEDPLANTFRQNYFDCFRVYSKDPSTDLSNHQIADLLGQVLTN